MIEVFKTNVQNRQQAAMLVSRIHNSFRHYKANFDLDDCDHILRVVSTSGLVEAGYLIQLLNGLGYTAEVLPDEV